MKYYRLFQSTDIKIIGHYPQVSDLSPLSIIKNPNFIGNLQYKKSTSSTAVPIGILHKNALITDFISAGILGVNFFISDVLKKILTSVSNMGVEFLPSSIVANNIESQDYWIINPYRTNYSFLDVKASDFAYMDFMQNIVRKKVKFDSVEDFFIAWEENKKEIKSLGLNIEKMEPLYILKISIIESSNIEFFSLSPIRPGSNGFFVSEELKSKIELAGCTGLIFKQLNESPWDK